MIIFSKSLIDLPKYTECCLLGVKLAHVQGGRVLWGFLGFHWNSFSRLYKVQTYVETMYVFAIKHALYNLNLNVTSHVNNVIIVNFSPSKNYINR